MKFTAIILARNSSSRFRGKHFKQIGNKYVIEHTIKCLIDNENISEVYIATGPFKKNNIFKKKLSPIFNNLKFYFHRNENRVVERIFFLSKKIRQKNLIIISGDCPLIDNEFLNRVLEKYKKGNYEISYSKKKLQHEGILITQKKFGVL